MFLDFKSLAISIKLLLPRINFIVVWQFHGAFKLDFSPCSSNEITELSYTLENGVASEGELVPDHKIFEAASIVQLEFCLLLRLLIVLYSNGKVVVCSVSKKGLKQSEFIQVDKTLGSGDAVCASVALEQQILAVGTRKGVVELYDLKDSASLIRAVSLYDWG